MELRGTGVTVLSVNPGPVTTEWQEVAGYDGRAQSQRPGDDHRRAGASANRLRGLRPRQALDDPRPHSSRWFMRATLTRRSALKLRVTERMYRPKK